MDHLGIIRVQQRSEALPFDGLITDEVPSSTTRSATPGLAQDGK